MFWDDFRGHAVQREMFRRSLARGRLAHAYVFAGPEGVGKRTFARKLACCLLCERRADADVDACGQCPNCRQWAAGTHPDVLEAARIDGKRDLTIDVFLGASERRGREGLCHDLALRPMTGRRRVAIVDDVQHLNAEAGNALLKTLEEPPSSAILVLVTSNLDALLPTLRSRCQLVRFGPLSDRDLVDVLVTQELVPDRAAAEAIVPLADGCLGVARQLLDDRLRNLRNLLESRLAAGAFDPLALSREVLASLEEAGGDSQEQRRWAGWIVRFAAEFYRRLALVLSGAADGTEPDEIARLAARWPWPGPAGIEQALALFDRTLAAQTHLDRAVPVPLALEALFDELSRTARPPTPARRGA